MKSTRFGKLLWAFLLAFGLLVPPLAASADEGPPPVQRKHYRHHGYRLPPERHVVEGVWPPGSGHYLINGRFFLAMTPACSRWVAGDRIRLVRGEWHGVCQTAVFHNLSRGSTCALQCPGARDWASWDWNWDLDQIWPWR